MYMFRIHIHPGSIHRERRQNSSLPVQNNRSDSFRRPRETPLSYLPVLIVLVCSFVLSGCGGLVANTSNGNPSASAGSFTASPATIAFGSVTVGSPATSTVSLANSSSDPVVISQLSMSNSSFSVDGVGTLPFTLAAKSNATLNVHFGPSTAAAASGQLVITSNSLSSPSTAIQLSGTGVAAPSVAALTVNASSIAFGNVTINTPSTQSVTLQSTGSAPVTVSGVSVSGTGFTVSGGTFPLTLNPSQSATLSVQFDPTAAGAATGQLTIASNASTNPRVQISLSGTGQAASTSYQVNLSWAAPTSSSDTVTGYNVYRAPSGGSSYAILNSGADSQTAYTDSTVQAGTTYQYYVTSVDSSGAESAPSNVATIVIP
jgi:hypothetical protein